MVQTKVNCFVPRNDTKMTARASLHKGREAYHGEENVQCIMDEE